MVIHASKDGSREGVVCKEEMQSERSSKATPQAAFHLAERLLPPLSTQEKIGSLYNVDPSLCQRQFVLPYPAASGRYAVCILVT